MFSKTHDADVFSAPSEHDAGAQLYDSTPFGPFRRKRSRQTFIDLVQLFNVAFPDHDLTHLSPLSFARVTPSAALARAGNLLECDEIGPARVSAILEALGAAIDLASCEVYELSSDPDHNPFAVDAVWSFTFLFYNAAQSRALLFACKMEGAAPSEEARGLWDAAAPLDGGVRAEEMEAAPLGDGEEMGLEEILATHAPALQFVPPSASLVPRGAPDHKH